MHQAVKLREGFPRGWADQVPRLGEPAYRLEGQARHDCVDRLEVVQLLALIRYLQRGAG